MVNFRKPRKRAPKRPEFKEPKQDCGPGKHWVPGHYAKNWGGFGSHWVRGHCADNSEPPPMAVTEQVTKSKGKLPFFEREGKIVEKPMDLDDETGPVNTKRENEERVNEK